MENNNYLLDVYHEVRSHLMGRNKLIDTVLPPIIFMFANYVFGLQPAIYASIGAALLVTIFRLARQQTLLFALGGLAAVISAAFLAWWLAKAESFFLPSIISNAALVFGLFISLLLQRPLMAFASFITRRWPLSWYWHNRVKPAYMEVTLAWAVFMTFRLIVQVTFYQSQSVNALGTFQILTGTPATIALLILSYLYGIWRLKSLKGPSVLEHKTQKPPPWSGQQRGF